MSRQNVRGKSAKVFKRKKTLIFDISDTNKWRNYSNIIDIVAKRTKGPEAGVFKMSQR